MKKLLILFITSFIYSATIHVPGDYDLISIAMDYSSNNDTILDIADVVMIIQSILGE